MQLTVAMPPGFSYLRVTNPGLDFRLVSVRRSDGKQLALGDNAWTTDRTFPSSQAGAIREKLLHLFDHDSKGLYSLNFAPVLQDTNPPSSAVAALPASSAPSFALEWAADDGVDGSGLAFFDIFVFVDGGPFTNWLGRTTQRRAQFAGVAGSTYAFYSLATDLAGNQELAPAIPDTQTRTSAGVNTAPSIIPIADVTIDEGTTFSLTPMAVDSDLPRQTLSYSLLAPPSGATIDQSSGLIRWETGEAQGGTSKQPHEGRLGDQARAGEGRQQGAGPGGRERQGVEVEVLAQAGLEVLLAALKAADNLRRRVLRLPQVTDAYRIAHAEGDNLPGLIVDRLGPWIVCEYHSLGFWRLREDVGWALGQLYPELSILHRMPPAVARSEGIDPPESSVDPGEIKIEEHGLRFPVRPGGGHKTGWFCDQRDNRCRVAQFAAGRDVVDLFCNAGGFGLHCAREPALIAPVADEGPADAGLAVVVQVRSRPVTEPGRENINRSENGSGPPVPMPTLNLVDGHARRN